MGRGGGSTVMMALGAVLALIAAAVVFFVTQTATAKPPEVPKKPVLVAIKEIKERTIITSDSGLVEIQQWPENVIPDDAITTKDEVEGKFAKTTFYPKQAILKSLVAGAGTKAGETSSGTAAAAPALPGGAADKKAPAFADIAYTLEKGQVLVAVSYPIAMKLVATGAVKPGDRVDIFVKTAGTSGTQIAPVFRNIQIKAIGSVGSTDTKASGGGGGTDGGVPGLIFAVPTQDALVLKFIEDMDPFIVLRAAGDNDSPPTDLVTIDYMISRFRLQRPTAQR